MADQEGHIYHIHYIHLKPTGGSPGRTIEVRADSIEGGDNFHGGTTGHITLKLEGDTVGKFLSNQVSGWSRSKLPS